VRSRILYIAFLVGSAILLSGLLVVRECAYGGGMGAAYKTCNCMGIEWEMYDQTPVDGPRKTICIGIIKSRTCYRSMGGPVIDCSDPR